MKAGTSTLAAVLLRHTLLASPGVITSALESNIAGTPQSLTDLCDERDDGRTQCQVLVDVPESCIPTLTSDPSCPVVFYLHAEGGSSTALADETGSRDVNFVGVYPQSEAGGWNTFGLRGDNTCEWDDLSCTADPYESGFIASIITVLRDQGASGRIYAAGHSDGGALALHLASNAGEALPLSGVVVLATHLLRTPHRSGPGREMGDDHYKLNYNQPKVGGRMVSVLNVVGQDDEKVPYTGGDSIVFELGDPDDFLFMSSDDSMQTWALHNNCHLDPTLTFHEDPDMNATYYGGCDDGHLVERFAFEGGHDGLGSKKIFGQKIEFEFTHAFITRIENGLADIDPSDQPEEDNGVLESDPTLDGTGSGGGDIPDDVGDAGAQDGFNPLYDASFSFEEGECVDDDAWVGTEDDSHNCEFVALDMEIRCEFLNADGVGASEACGFSCNVMCAAMLAGAAVNEGGMEGEDLGDVEAIV